MLKVIILTYRPSIILNNIEVEFMTVLAENLSDYVRMYALTYAQKYI